MLGTLLIVIVCLMLSAFFSGMEIAFVASNRLKLEIEKKQNRVFGYITDIFSRHPGQYITTILVGNNIALVIYSLNMTRLIGRIATYYGVEWMAHSIILDTILATLIIIFTAEFLPKAVVKVSPNFYMRIGAVPAYFFYIILYPIARFATWLSVALLRVFGLRLGGKQHIRSFDRVDLTNLVEEAVDNEYVNPDEHVHEIKLFRNAMEFSEVQVRDCMVPRVDIEAIEAATPVDELLSRFVETKYSRLMVYEGSIDNIIGYVNTKSLFRSPRSIADILLKVEYVPKSMPAQKLLTGMIKRKHSIAVVIDEFGGTAGMVSMEDALEEIFGEIEDEHDTEDLIEKRVGENEWVFSCRLEVDYLNEKYRLGIPESEDYDTLAGYIIFRNDGIPAQGEVLAMDGKEIRILRTSSSRVELARVRMAE
ncbi:MAG: hemolysin family protein [Rikenellaceae bacterium]|jgi:CBS domain containing-hemolysin-like protein|nr:hemolysin family protein [Rikenellaceae bacterium]